jgi:hypothetical protein
MSEQIKLKNGSVFEMIPMGVSESEKKRIFKFTSSLTYEEIKTLFSTSDNISSIDYILADGTTSKTYADCVSFKGLSFETDIEVEEGITTDVYTVTLSADAVEKTIKVLQSKIATLEADKQMLQDTVDALVLATLEPSSETEGTENV